MITDDNPMPRAQVLHAQNGHTFPNVQQEFARSDGGRLLARSDAQLAFPLRLVSDPLHGAVLAVLSNGQ